MIGARVLSVRYLIVVWDRHLAEQLFKVVEKDSYYKGCLKASS